MHTPTSALSGIVRADALKAQRLQLRPSSEWPRYVFVPHYYFIRTEYLNETAAGEPHRVLPQTWREACRQFYFSVKRTSLSLGYFCVYGCDGCHGRDSKPEGWQYDVDVRAACAAWMRAHRVYSAAAILALVAAMYVVRR